MRATLRGPAAVALVLTLLAEAADAQTLLDRVVARVSGSIILLSDVRAAAALGLIDAAPESDDAVEQMVQRALMLDEVGRFPPPEPAGPAIEAEIARLRARVGSGLEAVRRATGLTDDQLRGFARDRLRVQSYVDQRFGTNAALTDEQVLQYYRDHPVEFTVDGTLEPFDRVEGLARARAGLDRRRSTINQWITDLRARGDVTMLPRRP